MKWKRQTFRTPVVGSVVPGSSLTPAQRAAAGEAVFVVGYSVDNLPDADTQAKIDTLLAAGWPETAIFWRDLGVNDSASANVSVSSFAAQLSLTDIAITLVAAGAAVFTVPEFGINAELVDVNSSGLMSDSFSVPLLGVAASLTDPAVRAFAQASVAVSSLNTTVSLGAVSVATTLGSFLDTFTGTGAFDSNQYAQESTGTLGAGSLVDRLSDRLRISVCSEYQDVNVSLGLNAKNYGYFPHSFSVRKRVTFDFTMPSHTAFGGFGIYLTEASAGSTHPYYALTKYYYVGIMPTQIGVVWRNGASENNAGSAVNHGMAVDSTHAIRMDCSFSGGNTSIQIYVDGVMKINTSAPFLLSQLLMSMDFGTTSTTIATAYIDNLAIGDF